MYEYSIFLLIVHVVMLYLAREVYKCIDTSKIQNENSASRAFNSKESADPQQHPIVSVSVVLNLVLFLVFGYYTPTN